MLKRKMRRAEKMRVKFCDHETFRDIHKHARRAPVFTMIAATEGWAPSW